MVCFSVVSLKFSPPKVRMSDEEDFEEQLRQEEIERKKEDDVVGAARTRKDSDGTEYEWDPEKKAWFPKIDTNFIANYQMQYGTNVPESDSNVPTVNTDTTTAPDPSDPNYYQYYYNYYANAASTGAINTDSKEYREWYEKYYGKQAGSTESEPADPKKESSEESPEKSEMDTSEESSVDSNTAIPPAPTDVNSEEYYNWYYKYYGSYSKPVSKETSHENEEYWEQYLTQAKMDGGRPKTTETSDSKKDTTTETTAEDDGNNDGKDKGKGKGKRKLLPPKPPPSWFDMSDDKKNTTVYVTGLPPDITDDDFTELMKKCGLVMFDPVTRKPKLKLYKDDKGGIKGDGRCCYIKAESVDLALQILDGSDIRGHKIYVERAKFELKGKYDPSKRRRKLTKHEKKKFQMKQEKLFDWRPDKPMGARDRWERIAILKNVFDPKQFEAKPELILELRKEMEQECARFGDVTKVQVYDRHEEGVVSVTFKEAEMADQCVEAMNGRFYAQRQLTAITHDGKTKYHVKETEEEEKARLKEWDTFLDGEDGAKTKTATSTVTPAQSDDSNPGVSTRNADSAERVGDNVDQEDVNVENPHQNINPENVQENINPENVQQNLHVDNVHREIVRDDVAMDSGDGSASDVEVRQAVPETVPEGAAASGAEHEIQ